MKIITLSFAKLAGQWYVVLPEYPGHVENLEMVAGADVFLDNVSYHHNIVNCVVSDQPFENADFHMSAILENSKATGYYQYGTESLWLCEVNKYVWGGMHPKDIYVKIISTI